MEQAEGTHPLGITQDLLSHPFLKPWDASFGWPKAQVIDVQASRRSIFGKVKYLLLPLALHFNIYKTRRINKWWIGYWVQNKTLVLIKAPVKLQGLFVCLCGLWPHNSFFWYNVEFSEVRFQYCSYSVSKEYQEEENSGKWYVIDSLKLSYSINEFGGTGPHGLNRDTWYLASRV